LIHEEFKTLLENIISVVLHEINADMNLFIQATKMDNRENGTLFDLILACDNLEAFTNVMYYMHKASISGVVAENKTSYNVLNEVKKQKQSYQKEVSKE